MIVARLVELLLLAFEQVGAGGRALETTFSSCRAWDCVSSSETARPDAELADEREDDRASPSEACAPSGSAGARSQRGCRCSDGPAGDAERGDGARRRHSSPLHSTSGACCLPAVTVGREATGRARHNGDARPRQPWLLCPRTRCRTLRRRLDGSRSGPPRSSPRPGGDPPSTRRRPGRPGRRGRARGRSPLRHGRRSPRGAAGLALGRAAAAPPATPALGLSSSSSSSSSLVRLLGRSGLLGGIELGGDQRVVLGPEVDLVVKVDERYRSYPGRRRLQALFALEGLDLLDCDLELVRDPGIGAPLAHPAADPVQLGSAEIVLA